MKEKMTIDELAGEFFPDQTMACRSNNNGGFVLTLIPSAELAEKLQIIPLENEKRVKLNEKFTKFLREIDADLTDLLRDK